MTVVGLSVGAGDYSQFLPKSGKCSEALTLLWCQQFSHGLTLRCLHLHLLLFDPIGSHRMWAEIVPLPQQNSRICVLYTLTLWTRSRMLLRRKEGKWIWGRKGAISATKNCCFNLQWISHDPWGKSQFKRPPSFFLPRVFLSFFRNLSNKYYTVWFISCCKAVMAPLRYGLYDIKK